MSLQQSTKSLCDSYHWRPSLVTPTLDSISTRFALQRLWSLACVRTMRRWMCAAGSYYRMCFLIAVACSANAFLLLSGTVELTLSTQRVVVMKRGSLFIREKHVLVEQVTTASNSQWLLFHSDAPLASSSSAPLCEDPLVDARRLIPELCRQFYQLGWVTGTGGGYVALLCVDTTRFAVSVFTLSNENATHCACNDWQREHSLGRLVLYCAERRAKGAHSA